MTYALIITVFAAYGNTTAGFVTTLAGFKSEASCLSAGNAWLTQAGKKDGQHEHTALCVPQ